MKARADGALFWQFLQPFRRRTPEASLNFDTDQNPVRSEKFDSHRLAEHARTLAENQIPAPENSSAHSIAKRLAGEWQALRECYAALSEAAAEGEQLVPAAEWLIDNFHVLELQYRQIQSDLPPNYYRQLPKIGENQHLSGYPRVFGMAWAYIAHTDSLFDPTTFVEFVNAYQDVRPLAIGELWALPIHLRITLIENAARVARRTVVSRLARAQADALVAEIVVDESAVARVPALIQSLPDHARLSFLVHLIRRLRDDRGVSSSALNQINHFTRQIGHDFDGAIHEEHARLTANNVTMQNLFNSLKSVSDHDWELWFRAVSRVDHILDAGEENYARLDSVTRSAYRRQVEDLARHSRMNETSIAEAAVSIAGKTAGDALLGTARPDIEKLAGYRAPFARQLRNGVRTSGLLGYGGAIAILTLVTMGFGLATAISSPEATLPLAILCLLTLAPAWESAVSMVNYAITRFMKPVVLPALSFEAGIPESSRTMIAVPILIDSFHNIEHHLLRIESHALSNPDEQLFYSLISDWKDSDAAETEEDRRLLAAAIEGIEALNKRHGHKRFMLFHRARKWNPQERTWMGWERKRGKLEELNHLLRGDASMRFIHQPDNLPENVRFIIVLDADTVLPRGAARKLVGKMAHPLNRPVLDNEKRRVVSGYGIMQPRVTISLPERGPGTWYQRIYASRPGIDPYVFAVSDVYQDLFGEGTFTGKGIYDIDAFDAAIKGRVPDNAMLSHDLFEGSFARCAVISDVEVVESFPERYLADAARHHRWARGDWQLLPWIAGSLFNSNGLLALGLWKTIDNLRRSLISPLTVAAFIFGWIILSPSAALAFSVYLLTLMVLPSFLPILASGNLRREDITLDSQALTLLDDIACALRLTGARIVLLAHQAYLMLDAVFRTLVRLFITKHNLLEWTTAAQASAGPSPTLAKTYYQMAAAPALGAILIAAWAWPGIHLAWPALPFALAWLLSPAFAWKISQPPEPLASATASPSEIAYLRQIACRTWSFFETYVTPDENMLPPDNFQEDPDPVLAHRTSPTNIGLYLISTVAAHEMGWIGRSEALHRITASMNSISRMEKHRGHLFNWYDTQSLNPLEPRYVSTVDSGNLAGHLIALANACESWQARGPASAARIDGVIDIANILAIEWRRLARTHIRTEAECSAAAAMVDGLVSSLRDLQKQIGLIAVRLVGMLVQIAGIAQATDRIKAVLPVHEVEQISYWTQRLRVAAEAMSSDVTASTDLISKLNANLQDIALQARTLAYSMDFAFLMNPQRELLSIGYQVNEESLDQSCYDLLASEAALASFFAVAKSDARLQHWFRLGRPVVAIGHAAALVSWSGSMFEYLMPYIVLNYPYGTLLHQTLDLVVKKQISYAHRKDTPWGISEAAYSARDLQFTYQYLNFGVPGLGLKRGLENNHVVAPYATGLASMVAPVKAAANYAALEKIGARGRHGFYESVDYTASRLREDQTYAIVRAYFAHHQGMTISAIFNTVNNGFLRNLFHSENTARAAELLLQERTPNHIPTKTISLEQNQYQDAQPKFIGSAARFVDPRDVAMPITHLLSNGRYSVMFTATGGGYSRWNGIAINRWREDPVLDDWGMHIFLRNATSGERWSLGLAADPGLPSHYLATFSQEKAEVHRTDGAIRTEFECLVSSEQNAEARILGLVNMAGETQSLEITSYMELALAHPAADDAHPAFSKMFVHTEYLPDVNAIIGTRVKRADSDPLIWVAQFFAADESALASDHQFETSRLAFLGRNTSLAEAAALQPGARLAGETGHTLDPVIALRMTITIPAHRKVKCVLWTIVAETREELLESVAAHRALSAIDRLQVLAWTQSRVLLRHLSCDVVKANAFQDLASSIIYSSPLYRPPAQAIASGMRKQSALWALSISGSKPIVLIRVRNVEDAEAVEDVILGQRYWQEKGLAVDVVILNEKPVSYLQELQSTVDSLVAKRRAQGTPERWQGEIFVLRSDQLSAEQNEALSAAARVTLWASKGLIEDQICAPPATRSTPAPPAKLTPTNAAFAPPGDHLAFFNGFGGFDKETGEYVILHQTHSPLPAPWINVIANVKFGTQRGAEGGGYSWYGNSREFQITAWSNDPVADRPGEAFYVLDKDSGELLAPTVMPLGPRSGTFTTRHGFGKTQQIAEQHDLTMELTEVVDPVDPVKRARLRLLNRRNSPRTLAVTFCAELVMGLRRGMTAHYVTTETDQQTQALFAQNKWDNDFGHVTVFADLDGQQTSMTGNRRFVFGEANKVSAPAGLLDPKGLSGEFGGGYDPCLALQQVVSLPANGSADIVLTFGAADSAVLAREFVTKYRGISVDDTVKRVETFWADILGAVRVETPDPSFDVMMNGWLLYQTLSCRLFARAGFYQASGAYGFRDQLQDGMTAALVRPDLTRSHLLTAASRQFVEGDVQHWWLPSTGAGIRTRISDDTAWLAYCTAHYVNLTGDSSILDEQIPFLEARELTPDQHDDFSIPARSSQSSTLYEHCVRGLEKSMVNGTHGLPLMGTGDWNDGMNKVGEHGKGESVWLGWFVYRTLQMFEEVARARGDQEHVGKWSSHRANLAKALDTAGWDGAWYRRAYFDDGTPLGTADAKECQIDAIAQSWAVISGAADANKAEMAMESLEKHLIDHDVKIAKLFKPPFESTVPSPGYIQSYPAGIRENGGQYTHGAVWAIYAFAAMKQAEKAMDTWSLINPVNHALNTSQTSLYRIEPYVMAGDVYSGKRAGQGGWSWYTGASGWTYRAGLEAILGFARCGSKLVIKPCVPKNWKSYTVHYRFKEKRFTFEFIRSNDAESGAPIHQDDQFAFDLAKLDDSEIVRVNIN